MQDREGAKFLALEQFALAYRAAPSDASLALLNNICGFALFEARLKNPRQ